MAGVASHESKLAAAAIAIHSLRPNPLAGFIALLPPPSGSNYRNPAVDPFVKGLPSRSNGTFFFEAEITAGAHEVQLATARLKLTKACIADYRTGVQAKTAYEELLRRMPSGGKSGAAGPRGCLAGGPFGQFCAGGRIESASRRVLRGEGRTKSAPRLGGAALSENSAAHDVCARRRRRRGGRQGDERGLGVGPRAEDARRSAAVSGSRVALEGHELDRQVGPSPKER